MRLLVLLAILVSVTGVVSSGCFSGFSGTHSQDNAAPDDDSNDGTLPDADADDGASVDGSDADADDGNPAPDTGTGDDTEDPATDEPTSAALSDGQKDLAQMLVRKQTRLMEAIAAFAIMGQANTIPEEDGEFSFGTCPVISGERQGDGILMQLVYSLGGTCSNPDNSPGEFGGRVLLGIDYGTPNLVVTYEGVTVNGHLIGGFLQSSDWMTTRSMFNVTADAYLEDEDTAETSDVAIVGDVEIAFNKVSGTISVSGHIFVREYLDQFECELVGLMCDPVNNGNFVCEAGTVTTSYYVAEGSTEMDTFAVQFSPDTPTNGAFSVRVNEDEPVELIAD